MNIPVAGLTLPSNDEMLRESIVSMMREIQTRTRFETHSVLTLRVFRAIYESMKAMTREKDVLYIPDESGYDARTRDAVKKLTFHVRKADKEQFDGLRPAELKTWLDDWGLAYSVFAICYQPDWAEVRFHS
jgi:hypothetical protein